MAEEAVVVEETPAAEAPSMDDTIRDTLHEIESRGEETSIVDTPEETLEKPEKERGPDGKFVAKPKIGEGGEQPTEIAPETEEAPTEDDYPSGWKEDYKEAWRGLDPSIKGEIQRREQNFHDGIKQYKEPAAFGTAIGNEMLPYLETFKRLNTTPQQITKDLFSTWNELVTGTPEAKQSTLLRIARDFGINIASASSTPQKDGGEAPDDRIAALQQEIAELRRGHETQQQEQARLRQEAQQAEQAEIDEDIARFAADPKNEHFSSVKEIMGRLMTGGQAKTLAEAYEQACVLHPDVKLKVQAKANAERKRKEAEEAAAAKKAAAANVNRRGTHPETPKPGSMEDTIRSEGKRLGIIT